MEVIDQPVIQSSAAEVKYAGFGSRLGALIIDGIALAPFTFAITYFNITEWKSISFLILISLVGLLYKPFMEFQYGATLGKMALKIKVVNNSLEQPGLTEIVLRNIFHLIGSSLSLLLTINVFLDPEFENVTGFTDYTALTASYFALQGLSYVNSAVTVIDGIVLIADKQSRALHDKIGKTFVVFK